MSIKEELHRLVDLLPEEREDAAAARLRELVEASGALPWSAEDRAAWEELVARIRARIPAGLTPDDIEADIRAASEEACEERIAHREGARAA